MSIQCFVLEPTDYVSARLMTYTITAKDPCPNQQNAGHFAEFYLPREVDPPHWGQENFHYPPDPYLNGPNTPWPMICQHCNAQMDAQNVRHGVTYERFWRRVDTGEEYFLHDAPPGAMWYAPYYDRDIRPQLEHCVAVKLPDGTDWIVDNQASNCTMRDDSAQERHHCWIIEGTELPNITVSKNGPTCAAGAGSIQTPKWHGFLRNGALVI